MANYLRGQNLFAGDPEGHTNVESDCEEDFSEAINRSPGIERGEEAFPRAVLTIGSFSACVYSRLLFSLLLEKSVKLFRWKSLFFYRCTDEISFAPLTSQGLDSRIGYIRKNTVAASPPPCSPKSIYVLANLVW